MNIKINHCVLILSLVLFTFQSSHAQTPINVGPQTATFSSMIRGYHFTAPSSFTICGLYIPDDASTGFQRVRVVKFNAGAPPAYPGTTNNFTQLFSQSNVNTNAMIPCNITINAGDLIGVYGARGGNCTNSYGTANYVTNINGTNVTLQRSGMQSCPNTGPMANIWSEVNYKIGRIIMYTNCCSATPTLNVAPASVNICQGETTTLTASSPTTGGTFSWSPGGQTTASIDVTPTTTTTYTVTYSVSGCPQATATSTINVTPVPTPIVNNVTICEGESTTLNASVSPAGPGTFSWSTGASGPSITVNPITTTTYDCFYTLGNCPPTSSTVTVTVDPAPTITVSDHVICDGETITVTATPDSLGGTFIWSPGGQTTSSITVTPNSSIDYLVTYNLANCNAAIDTGNVIVNPSPDIICNDTVICFGQSANLTVYELTGSSGGTYLWNTGQTTQSINISPNVTTTYSVTYSLNGCSDSAAPQVSINPLPDVSFSADFVEGCAPFTANITPNIVTPTTIYSWNILNLGSFSGNQISPVFSTAGCFDVTLTANDGAGCTNSATIPQFICVDDIPYADFTPSASMFYELSEEMSFINNSTGASSYLWDFGDQSTSVQYEPTHLFQNTTGGYLVSLYAFTPLGCSDTASVVISYQEGIIYYIPNTFTPDGDNHNQIFKPIFISGYDPNNFNMSIYNRWGEVVFESKNSEIGWDGSYGIEGTDAPSGIYTYNIVYKIPTNDERKLVNGHVYLLR